jgi:hypothetical protein
MSASFFLCHDYIQACVCAIFKFLYPFFLTLPNCCDFYFIEYFYSYCENGT